MTTLSAVFRCNRASMIHGCPYLGSEVSLILKSRSKPIPTMNVNAVPYHIKI